MGADPAFQFQFFPKDGAVKYLKKRCKNNPMDKKLKKKMVITQEEHDEWHRKNEGYDGKIDKYHDICHRKIGITVKE